MGPEDEDSPLAIYLKERNYFVQSCMTLLPCSSSVLPAVYEINFSGQIGRVVRAGSGHELGEGGQAHFGVAFDLEICKKKYSLSES